MNIQKDSLIDRLTYRCKKKQIVNITIKTDKVKQRIGQRERQRNIQNVIQTVKQT